YPYKEVEYGAQIHESLIWESRGTTQIFGKDGVLGLVNVDLTPEVALRFGAALGTALKRGARVVASRESAPAYQMIKRAIISGPRERDVRRRSPLPPERRGDPGARVPADRRLRLLGRKQCPAARARPARRRGSDHACVQQRGRASAGPPAGDDRGRDEARAGGQ